MRNSAKTTGPREAEGLDVREVEELPAVADIRDGEIFGIRLSNDTTRLTHGLHRFAAKYIPHLPRWALREFAPDGATVWDPFAGSGTTLVEALRRPLRAVGTEIDPLARWISLAKTTRIRPRRLDALLAAVARRRRRIADPAVPLRGVENFEHWFSRRAWGELAGLLEAIDASAEKPAERRLLLVLFSSILRWVSNADDQSQKTYVSGTNPKSPPDVYETFDRAAARARVGFEQLHAERAVGARVSVPRGRDALASGLDDGVVDLVVTSPPYLDSVDYLYNMMMEYFWLGPRLGVASRIAWNARRRVPVGAKNPAEVPAVVPAALAEMFDPGVLSPQRARAAVSYFHLMDAHFGEAARVLKPDAPYVLVVGNSQTRDDILPVHDALLQLAAARGLELERAFSYRIRRHYMKFPRQGRGGIILLDWILVLRRRGEAVSPPDALPLPWLTLGDGSVAH